MTTWRMADTPLPPAPPLPLVDDEALAALLVDDVALAAVLLVAAVAPPPGRRP